MPPTGGFADLALRKGDDPQPQTQPSVPKLSEERPTIDGFASLSLGYRLKKKRLLL